MPRARLDNVSGSGRERILGSSGSVGENDATLPAGILYRAVVYARSAVGVAGRGGGPCGMDRSRLSSRLPGVAIRDGLGGWNLGNQRRCFAAPLLAHSAAGSIQLRGLAGRVCIESRDLGRPGIRDQRRQDDGDQCFKALAQWLAPGVVLGAPVPGVAPGVMV